MKQIALAVLLAGLAGFSPLAQAQETTAGSNLGTQASWSALSSMINATNGNVSALRVEVNAMKACGAQKKIWTGTSCVNAAVTVPTIDTSLYDKLVMCADKGQFYDKSANACVNAAGLNRWIERGSVSSPSSLYTAESSAKNDVIKQLKKKGVTRECAASERAGRQCNVTLGSMCYTPLKCSSRKVGSQDQKTLVECSSTYISCN